MISIKYVALFISLFNLSFILSQEIDETVMRDFEKSYICPRKRPMRCPKIYNPVCGYYDTTNIRCRFPCARNYANPCLACKDPIVKSFKCGKCPSVPSDKHVIIRYIRNHKWPMCPLDYEEEDSLI